MFNKLNKLIKIRHENSFLRHIVRYLLHSHEMHCEEQISRACIFDEVRWKASRAFIDRMIDIQICTQDIRCANVTFPLVNFEKFFPSLWRRNYGCWRQWQCVKWNLDWSLMALPIKLIRMGHDSWQTWFNLNDWCCIRLKFPLASALVSLYFETTRFYSIN